jgi:hypothetical protein
MSQTIPDITVGYTAWVDLNTESGIAVGDAMQVALKSNAWCRLYEGTSAPSLTTTDGEVLTDKRYPYNYVTIPAGSLKIWALSAQTALDTKVSVQEI